MERISQRGAGRGYKGELGAVVIWMEGDGDRQWSGSRYVLKVELKGVSDQSWYTGKDRGFSMHLKVFSRVNGRKPCTEVGKSCVGRQAGVSGPLFGHVKLEMSLNIEAEMAGKHGLMKVEFRREVHIGDIYL